MQASTFVLWLALSGVISTNPLAVLAFVNTPGTSSAKLNAPSLLLKGILSAFPYYILDISYLTPHSLISLLRTNIAMLSFSSNCSALTSAMPSLSSPSTTSLLPFPSPKVSLASLGITISRGHSL